MSRITILLKRARKKKGLNQKEVAEKMGILQPSFARMESGSSDISFNMINKFCQALEISLEELFKEDTEENQYQIKIDNLKAEDRKAVYKLIDSKLKE